MKLRGSRKVILESGYSLFETLGFFLVRAAADGYMKVTWRENKMPGDILGRRFSGVDNGMDPPQKPQKEGEPEPPSATDNAVDFGKVLAAHLEGDVLVPEGDNVFLQYLPDKGRWEAQKICDKGLHGFARQYSRIFEPVHCCWVDGVLQKRPRGDRLRPHVEVSYPLGKPSFLKTLAHESLIYLRCPAPKLDDPLRTNHRVLFEDGWVYDFRDGSFSRAKRSDFFKRSLPWKHCRPDWWGNEEVRKAAKELMELLKKSTRASIVEDSLPTEETLGMRRRDARRVMQLFEKLCAYDPFLKWLSASNEDIDEAIYVGKNFARALAGHPAFCELIWNCGPAQSGKDLSVAILQALAGTGSTGGYCATLKWGYCMKGANTSMEGCSPFLSATDGARFVFVSEVPNRRISMALLKPLCKQRGAEIASRGLYRGGNESFTPTALVVLTSNFQPRLAHDERQDTGSSTRVNVIAASSIFTENVRLPTHQQSDSRLADQVREGVLTPFAFHWLAEFYQLLDLVEHTRNVAPRPERIRQVSEMCFTRAAEARCRAPRRRGS